MALLGPVAGIGLNIGKGASDLAKGDVLRGTEEMLPKAIKDGLKGLRYGTEGVKDRTGVEMLSDVDAAELVTQVLGFSPARLSEAYAGRNAVMTQKREIDQRRQGLLRDYSRATIDDDSDAKARVRREISEFNDAQPRAKIDEGSLRRSVQNRRRRIDDAEDGVYLPVKQRELATIGAFANTR